MLEVSRATFRRDLDYLRERLGVPVSWDADAGGYRIEAQAGDSLLCGRGFEAMNSGDRIGHRFARMRKIIAL